MKKMRKILDSNIFWLVISFLLSLSVWVYVTSVETVESTRVFHVPVEIVGEDVLKETRDLVITDVDTNTVTVEIRGPRRVVNALSDSDLTAQVDVSRLSQASYTSLNYTIIYPSGTDRRNLSIVNKSQDAINFMVSKLTTKTVPVTGGFKGSAEEGYMTETPIFDTSTIDVTGPEVYLKNVDHADASFGDGMVLDSSYSATVTLTLVDASGKPCSTTNLTLSQTTVQATVTVPAVKDVRLVVNVKDENAAGANSGNTHITVSPGVIRLAGDSAVLAEINQISLDTIDLTAFESEYTETYVIPLPNGVRNLSQVSEATVTVTISDLSTKKMFVDVNDIVLIGGDGLQVTFGSESLPILLRGPAEVLSLLTADDVRVELDLTQYENATGDFELPVKILVPNHNNVGAIRGEDAAEYKIAVHLAKKAGKP